MPQLISDPRTFIFAVLGGVIPCIFWLWFWLRQEDKEDPEPRGLIALSFIFGAILVAVAICMEKYSLNFISDKRIEIIIWATIEEVLKFIGVMLIIFRNKIIDEPIDYPVYFITVALGFAAFENFSYLLKIDLNGKIIGLITGNLRFLGSTILHMMASAMVGSALGLAFYLKSKKFYILIGLICAISLHSVFNFFIMKGSGENFLSVFGFLWVVAIINILIFEKLKRMGRYKTYAIKS